MRTVPTIQYRNPALYMPLSNAEIDVNMLMTTKGIKIDRLTLQENKLLLVILQDLGRPVCFRRWKIYLFKR